MFYYFMFICNLLIPLLMLLSGWLMWKHCPKKINSLYGYRTSRSMKNMDTWKFAHDSCGRLWWKIGWVLLFLSAIVQIPFYNSNEDIVGMLGLIICMVQLMILILSIIPVERGLKKVFNEEGSRK